MDPKELERMAREMGMGGGGMPKLPGMPGAGGFPGLPGIGKKK
jgi:hypothetical protein